MGIHHSRRNLSLTLGSLVLAVPLALGGCADPVTGTVTSKSTDRDCKTKKSGSGTKKRSKKVCETDYELMVRDAQGETHEVDVSKSVYDRMAVGAQYKG